FFLSKYCNKLVNKKNAKYPHFPKSSYFVKSILCFLTLSISISILTSFNSPLFAAATGGQPGQFLQWAAGARSLGMGKAFFSVADDASATYWNPAGMVQLDRNEVIALHSTLWAGTSYDFISLVYPTPKSGVIGGNIVRMYTGGFEKIDFSWDPNTNVILFNKSSTFSDDQIAVTAAYGRKVMQNASIGVAGKLLQRTLDVHTDQIFAFDVTFLMKGLNHTLPGITLGFGINNLITKSFNTKDELPMTLRLGASHKFLRDKFTASLDLIKGMKANLNWAVGAEYWVVNFLAFRMGFDGESGFRESSMGLGFKYKDYSLDYAFAFHDLGPSTMRISGAWRFGRSVVQNREATVRRLLQEAVDSYRRGNYLVSFNRTEKAYSIDPANKEVQKLIKKLQVVIGYFSSAAGDTDEQNGLRKGIVGYLEDDAANAVSGLKYAYYKNPQNSKALKLLNMIEKENNMPPTEAYKEEVVGFTIIEKKLFDASQAVIDGKYDQALIRCQEVLNLEPNNERALEIMGSAFFMMNQPEKAKEVWSKVLEINPDNKIVKEYLEQLQ
ncbi:MAG: PorV/PorQ family protein, partial [Elusimicrobiota bacterium]